MHFQPYLQLRLFQKLMVVMLLLSLLVSGDQTGESVLVAVNSESLGVKEKKPVENQQHGSGRLRHSFYVFFSSKRKVPHSSDPLHNR
ncbi:hypothetical protein HRI_002639000 [Hibiscus trionum]|uniref:Uncharacterized protein n=1 Tax=Hibiscus trionum TaxID=183268 RepID=A0A9W7I5Z9_HIBTR|nr:hypothetical protein HRI_002639000 [Hibiscus trionum]